jgi:hypothetical protein
MEKAETIRISFPENRHVQVVSCFSGDFSLSDLQISPLAALDTNAFVHYDAVHMKEMDLLNLLASAQVCAKLSAESTYRFRVRPYSFRLSESMYNWLISARIPLPLPTRRQCIYTALNAVSIMRKDAVL